MIIEHRTQDKHQNADSLSKKTEFYERQEQREADRPEIKDGFSFMDKETYDSLPLTRWLDKSGKPIEDHPELPKEPPGKTILKKSRRIPIEIILKSKIVRETLKAKGYDLNQVEAGTAQIDDDLMRLLEKLSDDKHVIQEKGQEEPEVTILRRKETVNNTDSSRGSVTDSKDVVRSLVDKIPENILEQTKVRKKKVAFKEDTEHLGLGQESREWSMFTAEETGEGKLSGEEWDEDSETDDGLSSCSNFPERPTLDEMQTDKTVLPEIEHLRGKLTDEQLEAIKDVLERNEEVFSRHKADIGCCNFVEHEIELEENAVPHREGARRMTPHKLEACRKEIETLLEYDMWACGVVMAKKKGDQLRFCCDFRYLNSVTVKDAYPIPWIDESLSK